jgi:hypothetical protein
VTAQVEIIGVRHHSPACARLVAARLRAFRPQWVLIEGPSDFNDRIGELQSPEHVAPIAIFSYYGDAAQTRHTFAPFADYSPEWIALQVADEIDASVRFIDLPYWHEGSRGRAAVYGDTLAQQRQSARERALAQRLGIDGSDALWDHLFEQAMPMEALARRLDTYFDELRRDEPGDASDCAREAYMAQWIAQIAKRSERVLVVCGGWHRLPLMRSLTVTAASADAISPDPTVPETITRHGSFLIPYSDRRLEAFGGYGAGVQSPAYYRWLYQDGAEAAAAQAQAAIVQRLRNAKQTLSTASLIAAATRTQLLAQLRGHEQPLRVDVLDGLLDALSGEALSAPPPWNARGTLSMRDDPGLREALLALTGDRVGRLAPGTPLPPLVFDVEALLEALDLTGSRVLKLDRHTARDNERAQTLWRLRILSIPGIDYQGSSAPQAARQLSADQHHLEQWQLQDVAARHTALIEAGAYGPTLQSAALRVLSEQLGTASDVEAMAELYATAVRAGYSEFGDALLPDLNAALLACADHGALARAGLRLLALSVPGLGLADPSALLRPALGAVLARLLWLLEGLSGATQPAHAGDVSALSLVDRMLDPIQDFAVDRPGTRAAIVRIAANIDAPPSARGACFAVLWRHPDESDSEAPLLAAVKGYAQGEQLGDFLFGLFALARNECVRSQNLIGVLDAAIGAMTDSDFLVAAAALRQAFHYFPPRERAEIGTVVSRLHGVDRLATPDWLNLPSTLEDLQRSARLLQEIDSLRTRFGL